MDSEDPMPARFFRLKDFLGSNDLALDFTRQRDGPTPSRLDRVLIKDKIAVHNLRVLTYPGLSDHALISFEFLCGTNLIRSATGAIESITGVGRI
ncbi:uncharacterized protein DEA37_0013168 [Paragonimus westermani]|uniref:Endonuclease/exonuclease/phosphatase domain-containing protein n=1 Tax=Paragonimus westermani TaxID=34504 RepID=A0A5J4NHS9_9TREM|nr:uncharacterized protein DEA37_0013168 [Paragonimus westermani]